MALTHNCKLCGDTYDHRRKLTEHFKKKHDITPQQYYDIHLKQSKDEGFCLNCKEAVDFINLGQGYKKFCNIECRVQYQKTTKEVNENEQLAAEGRS